MNHPHRHCLRSRPIFSAGLIVAATVLTAATAWSGLGDAGFGPPPEGQATGTATAAALADECLQPLAWLGGVWVGDVNGDRVEETWSEPSHDSILGMFRWQSKGRTTLYELLSIKAQAGVAVLRLRHFDAGFEPWKSELGGVAALPLAESGESHALFRNDSDVGGIAACGYRLDTQGRLVITVSFKDPQRPELSMVLERAGGSGGR